MPLVDHSPDPALLLLSLLITAIASYTGFSLAKRMSEARGPVRLLWLLTAAVIIGIGIWTMHFIGMLAFRQAFPLAHDVPLMGVSMLVAISGSLLALLCAVPPRLGLPRLFLAANLLAMAMIGTHHTGVASLRPPEQLRYDPWLLALSLIVAVGGSLVTLMLFVSERPYLFGRHSLVGFSSAASMATVVTGFHYSAIAAARFVPARGDVNLDQGVLATRGLGALVVTGTLVILGFALLTIAVDQSRAAAERRARRHKEAERRLELRVSERTGELLAANRELEVFTYSTSHDLRTPLRGISGYSAILQEEYGENLDDRAKGYLQRIQSATELMGELIDNLVYLTKLSRTELESRQVDLSKLARSAVAELRQGEPGRLVTLEVENDIEVWGDERLLRIALENLLQNAWKFTSDCPEARIEIGTTQTPFGRAIYVRDNGAGFDMRYADKLFLPFQRLHSPSEFEGSGVGLAVVQRVVARHEGRVWAESEPGKGSVFYLSLGGNAESAKPGDQEVLVG
jgi:signal transduction histidine kinase